MNRDILEKSVDQVLETDTMFYKEVIDQLSITQLEMLNAAINGVVQFTSTLTIRNYSLGSQNIISKNKNLLEHKDIIEFSSGTPVFVDLFLKLWYNKLKR